MNVENLDGLLSRIGCDDGVRALLLPLFRRERLPRGMVLSVHQDAWDNVGIISSGYLRGYFRHDFEEYTLGLLGPGMAMPMFDYFGDFPADIFVESVTRVELFSLDIHRAAKLGYEQYLAATQLLVKSHASIFGELTFWASLNRLPRGASRVAELMNHGGGLIGSLPNGVLAAAVNMSLRHFVRIKNSQSWIVRKDN